MARVLIAGCGYVGSALAQRLARAGHEVFALRRHPQGLASGIHEISADLTDETSLRAIPTALDVVCYTTASDATAESAYRAAYVDGLACLLRATSRIDRPPSRLVLCSSTAVYAQHDGQWVDEDSATEPHRFQGSIMLESEAVALASGIPAVAVRFGGIYGPGRTRMLERVRAGELPVSDQPQYTNRIHRDDCAGVLEHLSFHPAPRAVYLGVDHEPADRREVTEWLAERMGAPKPAVAHGDSGDRGKRCSNARLLASGYAFRYPTFREGYAEIIAGL